VQALILAFTKNPEHVGALRQAAMHKGYALDVQPELSRDALGGQSEDLHVIVVDLTARDASVGNSVALLDSIEAAALPPVLYLLNTPAEVALVSTAQHVVNQDFIFAPVTPEALALRLEVLMLLGARRRIALESAITDRLTGLFNRKYFVRRLEEEMYRAQRYGYSVGCILADVDFIGGSEMSEASGASAVKSIAQFLIDRLRRTDVVARFRFSEYGVLLPDIARENTITVAGDLKQKIEALAVEGNGEPVRLHAAVAQLTFPTDGVSTALEVIDALEDCCLAAKSRSEDAVVSYAAT
jgi:diguanylate cyclase (GGDEF)-like protein